MTLGLNLAFIGKEIYTLLFIKQFGLFNRTQIMQLNNFTTHPKLGQNEPLDLGLICSCLSTAFFKQTNMGLLAIQILKDVHTFMCLLFCVLKFILKDKIN